MPIAQILIADDDAYVAEDLQTRLESLDYRVCATTGLAQDAITLATNLKPDLVLMDILFGEGMDGIQAGAQILASKVPVIYVTGYWDGPILDRASSTEPYGYLVKPYETAQLKTNVELALHRHKAECHRRRMAALKTLSGLLPICCYCKKIKEGDSIWTQIEAYIMQRTDASFTHGMCPECFDRVKNQLDSLDTTIFSPDSIILG